jgi:hypothetical protein
MCAAAPPIKLSADFRKQTARIRNKFEFNAKGRCALAGVKNTPRAITISCAALAMLFE